MAIPHFHAMKKLSSALALALTAALTLATPNHLLAGNLGAAPSIAQDAAADLGDLYAFLDPNDNTKVVLIATFHSFLVSGEVNEAAVFDENIRYRFEIYNDHVNSPSPYVTNGATAAQKAAYLKRVVPNHTIDFTFTKREVGDEPQTQSTNGNPIPTNLRRPKDQIATVTLGGFAGIRDHGIFPGPTVTPFRATAAASPLFVYEIPDVTPGNDIRVFAGEVDDPFFADVPAFSNYLDSFRINSPSTAPLSRGRDTFAGYNILAVAVRLPAALLTGPAGDIIGVDLLAQRHATEMLGAAGSKGNGAYHTVSRMGNPILSQVLIPYDLRDRYNAATVRSDVTLQFANPITETLSELGIGATNSHYAAIRSLLIDHGDLVQLDTSILNTGSNAQAIYPHGRRITDDAMDIILTFLNSGTTLTDNVNGNDSTIPSTFPFLALPHQPLFNTSVDDGTRN